MIKDKKWKYINANLILHFFTKINGQISNKASANNRDPFYLLKLMYLQLYCRVDPKYYFYLAT